MVSSNNKNAKKKKKIQESPLWLSGLRIQHSIHEDSGSIPGLDQGSGIAMAVVWACNCSSNLTLSLGNFYMLQVRP